MKSRKQTGKMIGVLSLFFIMTMINPKMKVRAAENDVRLGDDTEWYYSDNEADPSGDWRAEGYDRVSWTKSDYVPSDWKSGKGSFGAKNGAIAELGSGYVPDNLITQYKEDGTTDIEAFFFRTSIDIQDVSKITKIAGSIIYDDAATVYINGVRIAGFDDEGITENMQYGGSNEGTPKTGSIEVIDTSVLGSVLKTGTNIIAVELHQGRAGSSDVYFEMPELTFSTEEASYTQKNISLNVGKDETEMNITWYANIGGEGSLYIAKQSSVLNGEMPADAGVYTVTGNTTNKPGYYNYQTTVTALSPNTTYAYQLVNGTTKSEVKTFTTTGSGSFTFAVAGDPQIGASGNRINDTDGWEKTLNILGSRSEFSDVDFLLSAGDQVNTASDEKQYDGYLEHNTLYNLPMATVIGNHDSGSGAYSEHFNHPNESTKGMTAAGGDYYFVYNNVLFMALNSNNTSTAEHKAFMEQAIRKTEGQNIEWKVVTFHHSIYSVASHSIEDSIITRREELVPIFQELDIDVVLMGHDHVYCRTYMMDGLNPVTDASVYDNEDYSAVTNPEGILYVTLNSASGSKFYAIKNVEFPYSRVMNQENVPNISKVEVTDTSFTITTYRTSDMSQVDAFTIHKAHIHQLEKKEAKAATCKEEGNSAYWYCGKCGKYFSDALCEQEITPEKTVLAKTNAHQYGAWKIVEPATTAKAGCRQRVCSVCKNVETEMIPAETEVMELCQYKLTAKNRAKVINVKWHRVKGAFSYNVYVYSRTLQRNVRVANVTGTNARIAGISGKKLTSGTRYTIKVVACDKNKKELANAQMTITAATAPVRTQLTAVKRKSSSKAELRWKKSPGASGYEIYMKTGNGSYKCIQTIKGNRNKFTKTGLKKSKKYCFKVRAYKTADGKKIYGLYSKEKTIVTR